NVEGLLVGLFAHYEVDLDGLKLTRLSDAHQEPREEVVAKFAPGFVETRARQQSELGARVHWHFANRLRQHLVILPLAFLLLCRGEHAVGLLGASLAAC
ncbi:hypothetical protein PFISCL1PPCAC_25565, partial [Pristionchus fissidentatus]